MKPVQEISGPMNSAAISTSDDAVFPLSSSVFPIVPCVHAHDYIIPNTQTPTTRQGG